MKECLNCKNESEKLYELAGSSACEDCWKSYWHDNKIGEETSFRDFLRYDLTEVKQPDQSSKGDERDDIYSDLRGEVLYEKNKGKRVYLYDTGNNLRSPALILHNDLQIDRLIDFLKKAKKDKLNEGINDE